MQIRSYFQYPQISADILSSTAAQVADADNPRMQTHMRIFIIFNN